MDGFAQLMAIASGQAPAPPMADTLGIINFAGERGAISVELDPQPRHYNMAGTVHGGVLSALLDTAAGCSVLSTLPEGEGFTSLDLTVKFLRPVTTESGRLRSVGAILQRGRRTALAQAQCFDAAGKLVAHATSTCLFVDDPST